MAYTKRIPPIKLILTIKEYNNLIEVLTQNINNSDDDVTKKLATLTKEKLLKYSIPRKKDENNMEIDVRLYINEAADIISQLLSHLNNRIKEINYYEVLLKIRETIQNDDDDWKCKK